MSGRIGKHRETRRIDARPVNAAGVASGDGSGFTAPPVPPVVPAPGAPTLSTLLSYSAVTPSARIDATWAGLETYDLETYAVAISTDATFATGTEIYTTAPNQNSVAIDGRTINTTYYVRVRTVVGSTPSDWSPSASITTPVDTTPPAAVTGQNAAFINTGDLVVWWANPTSANFKDVEVKIYASNGGSLYATLYTATGRLVWTAAENLAVAAGDPTLYVELRSRSYGNVFAAAVAVSATKAAPTAPTIAVDFTGADAVFTITPPSDTAFLAFVADTGITARALPPSGRYVYPFDQNRLDHGGIPDPVLIYAFTAVDGLNQSSSATSGTATNLAPSAPTVTLIGGFSQLVCSVTSAKAVDFLSYEFLWKRDGGTVLTLESASSEQQYAAGAAGDEGAHSWTCEVRQKDVFNQFSTVTASTAVVLDTLTIGYLRSGAYYSDDIGSTYVPPNGGALAALKDGSPSAGGVSYSA